MTKIYFVAISLLFLVGCSSSKTISFNQVPDDIYTTQGLSQFLSQNKNPKVVLRVTDAALKETEELKNEQSMDYLYSIIENQLMKSGFQVRDRHLFSRISGNDQNTLDYEKIKEKSDTDLIIELSRLEYDKLYKTNQYTDKKGNIKVESYGSFEKYGASVEFKVILITKNDLAGTYKFNYTPCTSGCIEKLSFKDQQKEFKKMKKQGIEPYKGVEKDDLELFIKDATNKLVIEMRK